MKKLGFGMMRLPLTDPKDQTQVDRPQARAMMDAFLARGFTYVDTAYFYHGKESERVVKDILTSRYPRESYYLADKMPITSLREKGTREEQERIFDEQLEKCGVDYFDRYLVHCVNAENYKAAKRLDTFGFLAKKRDEGKLRHLGFSYHDNAALLDQILTEHPEVEFVQLQLNYLDWEDERIQSRKCYETVVRHGKKVVVMEPVKGGRLARLPEEAEKLLREAEAGAGRWKVSPLREAAGPLRKRALLGILRASGLSRTAEAAASLDRVVMGEARGFSAGGVRFGCRGGELWREEEAVFLSGAAPIPELEEGEEKEICFSFQKSLPGRAEPEILRKTVRLRLFPVQKGEETPKVYKNLLYSGIEYATIMNNVVLRARRPGDSIRLPGVGRKAVKKLFQEARFSREERETRLMLAKGSDIVWLEGFGAGEDYRFRGEGVMLGIQAEGLTERTR